MLKDELSFVVPIDILFLQTHPEQSALTFNPFQHTPFVKYLSAAWYGDRIDNFQLRDRTY